MQAMPQSVVVVFQFGSAICFQTSPEQEREFVGLIQAHTMQALASTRTDCEYQCEVFWGFPPPKKK